MSNKAIVIINIYDTDWVDDCKMTVIEFPSNPASHMDRDNPVTELEILINDEEIETWLIGGNRLDDYIAANLRPGDVLEIDFDIEHSKQRTDWGDEYDTEIDWCISKVINRPCDDIMWKSVSAKANLTIDEHKELVRCGIA